RISNHTDFDALRLHPQVDLQYVGAEQAVPAADLIILPGSKNTRQDLQWLRDNGWEQAIQKHLRYGGKVLGICGGFQMLGQRIEDPEGLEGAPGGSDGMGYLAMATTLEPHKQLERVSGTIGLPGQPEVTIEGYEIHMGVSSGSELQRGVIQLTDAGESRREGALSQDGQVLGTYLHGLFDHADACRELLRWAGLSEAKTVDYRQRQEAEIERLADTLGQHMDLQRTFAHLGLSEIWGE
ncbi:MAG: cobyric acid synthase CobQ, partial [Pseudomonadota bacterium]|nr:cobyric acid synthase CobQ [Pseudomonadota bacterium]